MKKWLLSLLVAGAVAVPSSAMALDSTRIFSAFIDNGNVRVPVGQMLFSFDVDIPGRLCRYVVEWDNNAFFPLSAQCYLDEGKAHGNFSCLSNSLYPVQTIVQRDTHFPCFGFDKFQQFREVYMLVAGESGITGELQGLIQFTGAIAQVYGFGAIP